MTPKDTAEIREKMLELWKLVDSKQITTSEARMHISIARTILETIKVEIAFAHLSRSQIPSVPLSHLPPPVITTKRQ